jgi:hypothetical protein
MICSGAERRVEKAERLGMDVARFLEAADPWTFRRKLRPLETVTEGIRRRADEVRRQLLNGNADIVVGWITETEPTCDKCVKRMNALIREVRSFRWGAFSRKHFGIMRMRK